MFLYLLGDRKVEAVNINIITSITTERASFEKRGDSLIINGEEFDFSPLLEGERLPMHAIKSDFMAGAVERHNGVLTIPIRFPVSDALASMIGIHGPIIDAQDGPLDLPKEPEIVPPEIAPETPQEDSE